MITRVSYKVPPLFFCFLLMNIYGKGTVSDHLPMNYVTCTLPVWHSPDSGRVWPGKHYQLIEFFYGRHRVIKEEYLFAVRLEDDTGGRPERIAHRNGPRTRNFALFKNISSHLMKRKPRLEKIQVMGHVDPYTWTRESCLADVSQWSAVI